MTIIKRSFFKRFLSMISPVVALGAGSFLLSACGSHSGTNAAVGTPNPTIEGPVAGTPALLGTTQFSLADLGYEQSEFFISGKARSFTNTTPLTSDGNWSVRVADEADYKTRFLVYRPIDPAAFNGTVIVEWFNVSGGADTATEWITAHTELARKGYVWVGISAQKAGIEGGGVNFSGGSFFLKALDPQRYATLVHPGDKYSFDIYSQAAQALLHPTTVNPLAGLQVQRAIAIGQSQSADFLVTYYNAIAPIAKLFDGYLIHSRFHGTQGLDPQATGTGGINFAARSTIKLRTDLNVPTMIVQTETDLLQLGAYYFDRQPDTQYFRTWEIAGSSHADLYVGGLGLFDKGGDPSVVAVVENASPNPVVNCSKPVNSGPQRFVVSASITALDNWLRNGVAPAYGDRLDVIDNGTAFATDSVGNVLGGIRTPYVDAPVAVLSGVGQTGSILCSLFGTTQLLNNTQLASLYPDHATFVAQVNASLDSAVSKGFVLQPDADLIKTWAQTSNYGNP